MEYNYGDGLKNQLNSDKNRNKAEMEGKRNGPINTSTPIEKSSAVGTSRIIGSETPKSVKSLGRNLRSSTSADKSRSTSSFFESSSILPMNTRRNSNRNILPNAPRISLFSETKTSGSPLTSGDFAEDEDDFLFSQIDLPPVTVEKNHSKVQSKVESKCC